MFKSLFLVATLLVLTSCESEDVTSSPPPATVSWAPRLAYATGTTIPKVDKVRLEITLADGKGTVLLQEVPWSQGKVAVDNIPSGVAFTAQVRGLLTDGSEVWNGTTNVQGGSGAIAINSQVTVAPSVGIDLALDESALTSPAAGSFPRVSVNGWPFAASDIHVLYTTDGSTPTMGGSSTQEYAGPFTLQGSGNLVIRAYRTGAGATVSASSPVLRYAYSGSNLSTCTVPSFMPAPGVLNATGSVSVNTTGTSNCELRYRTDGIDPTGTDPLWADGAIFLGSTRTHLKLRAIGPAVALRMSPVMEGSWQCPACTPVTAASITALGSTNLDLTAGMSVGLGVQLSGAAASQVTWSLEEGSAYAGIVGTGATAQLNALAVLPGGVVQGNVVVRAAIAGTDKFVRFNVRVLSNSGVTLTPSGNTVVGVNADASVPLSVTVTGADPSQVTWGIETGNALVVFESGSTGGTVRMKAGNTAVSGSATVRATLPGTGKSVLFTLNFGPAANQSGTISASGPTSLNITAGETIQLSTMVTAIDLSQVSWTVESGSTLVFLPAMKSGSVVQLQAYSIVGSGVLGTATVRASLPNGTSVVFNLTVSAPVQAKADPLPPASGDQGFAGEARKGA